MKKSFNVKYYFSFIKKDVGVVIIFKIEALRHRIYIDSNLPSKNDTKKQIKQLLREELILRYKQLKNIHLNPGKKNEIESKIQDLIGFNTWLWGLQTGYGNFQLLATAEAIFGTFMWPAFIATFSRKYMR